MSRIKELEPLNSNEVQEIGCYIAYIEIWKLLNDRIKQFVNLDIGDPKIQSQFLKVQEQLNNAEKAVEKLHNALLNL